MEIVIIVLLVLIIAALGMCLVWLNRQISDMKSFKDESEERFSSLADRSLKHNAMYLEQIGSRRIDSLLNPLRMRLEDFNRLVDESHTESVAARKSMTDQIDRLCRLNSEISEETRRLADALKGNNRIQGKWGETVLESILENAGLIKGVNYHPQYSVSREDEASEEANRRLRPDMLVSLPDSRNIVIDSKASLSAYLDYCSSPDREEAQEYAGRHVASIRRHIEGLSSKQYHKNVKGAMDQVLMFVPNDAALILAVSTDPELAEFAARKNVSLVGPMQLMIVIRLVADIWKKEYQDRNANEIARVGGLVYDAAASFLRDMKNIERGLDTAKAAYAAAFRKLSDSPRSLMARAERLREMGVRSARKIDTESLGMQEATSGSSERGTADRD